MILEAIQEDRAAFKQSCEPTRELPLPQGEVVRSQLVDSEHDDQRRTLRRGLRLAGRTEARR
jgi:hypothetical protein